MWYVVQTVTGEEQALIHMAKKLVPASCYRDFFILKREYARKEKEGYRIYLEPFFPSYVFVDTKEPEELFFELKKIPKLTKLLGNESGAFSGVTEGEQEFLEGIQDGDAKHIVHRSLVDVDSGGQIVQAYGALAKYQDRIVRQRLRKRYVIIEQELLGKKREIMMGIRLRGDREILIGIRK